MTPSFHTHLGKRLRDWRKKEGHTQESAARRLGVASTTWSHWETGRRLPTPRLLFLIKDMTGLPLGTLLCENSHRCPYARRVLSTLSRVE